MSYQAHGDRQAFGAAPMAVERRAGYCPTCGRPFLLGEAESPICSGCGRMLRLLPSLGAWPRPAVAVGPPPLPRQAPPPWAAAPTAQPLVSTPPVAPGPVAPAPPAAEARRGTAGVVVALWLYFFFPVGLYLLWTNPKWDDGRKWKYTIIWLSIIGGIMLLGLLASALSVLCGAARTF